MSRIIYLDYKINPYNSCSSHSSISPNNYDLHNCSPPYNQDDMQSWLNEASLYPPTMSPSQSQSNI